MLRKKDWLSVQEAADALSLSVGRIRQLLLANRLDGMKLNERAWAVSAKSIRDFQQLKRPPGNPAFVRKAR